MQFSELRDRVDALIKLGGWSNVQPEPNLAFLVNEGLRIISRMTCHNVETFSVSLVVDTKEYTLDTTTGAPAWISLNDDVLLDSTSWISQTTRDQLRKENKLWRVQPHGTVGRWYWTTPGVEIGVYPKPSATGTLTGEGPRHEPLLDDDTDTPILNEDFHEGICLFAAWHHGKLYARGEERAIAEGYYAEGEAIAEKCKGSMASQEAGCFIRRVSRAPQEYMGIGSKQSAIFWP